MTSPIVSLVVPSRGGRQRLPQLFEALEAQTDADFEVIVVCDGDIDDSAQVVESAPLNARAIVFAENRGRSAALNAGFDSAQGDVLVRCDDDLVPGPEYVARHRDAHALGEVVGAVGLYRNKYPPSAYARVYGEPRDRRFREEAYLVSATHRWRYWAGNVSIHRDLWQRVGPYDTRYRAYGWEDVDWGYRAHQSGATIRLIADLETEHRVAATTTEVRARRAYASGAARMTFVDKHGPQVLGATSRPGGPWGWSVHALAAVADDSKIAALSRRIDWIAGRAPDYVGEKLISLAVEAAALSGQARRPTHDVTEN